jgi:N-acetylglutamate synthase-like GNAT family acetyltransferase
MVTYFLGKEEVAAYLRDFMRRLKTFEPVPTVWCPMTPSGNELLSQMLSLVGNEHPDLAENVSVIEIQISPEGEKIRFSEGSPQTEITGKSILLFDSAIHSGSTMAEAAAKLFAFGAKDVCTYSLVVKRCTGFVPTMWGLMIDETDRAFFLLDAIPNQRLHRGMSAPAPLHIERLDRKHLSRPLVVTNVESMNRITWGDRFFDMSTNEQGRCSYLLHNGESVAGYLTVHWSKEKLLVIDEVAIDERHQGKKWGGVLVRFAETLARQSDCRLVRLYAVKEKVELYKHLDYELASEEPLTLENEEYFQMEKVLLHSRLY